MSRLKPKDIPWHDSKKWKPGYWYPMPLSQDIEYLGVEATIERGGWALFRLEPGIQKGDPMFGDIDTAGPEMPFLQVVELCNLMNPTKLFTAPWIKEEWAKADNLPERSER